MIEPKPTADLLCPRCMKPAEDVSTDGTILQCHRCQVDLFGVKVAFTFPRTEASGGSRR